MSKTENFDILILGSGAAGKLLAWTLGGQGKRVAVVERRWVGGSCPNIACMPSKNEIISARVAYLANRAGDFGTSTGAVEVDMMKVRQRKREMVEGGVAFHKQAFSNNNNELIMGSGRFVAPKTIEVTLNDGGTRLLSGDQVIINVGTSAAIPNVPGLAESQPLTHIEALELDYAPKHLVVLGGGYIGLELAQTYRRFGSQVTVVETGTQLMGREDQDVGEEMLRIFKEEGIKFVLGADVRKVEGRSGDWVSLSVKTAGGDLVINGTDLLVAAGRTPNTKGIGLENVGIGTDARGFVRVNDRLQTDVAGVWAAGECAGSPFFTHVSADDFRIILDNLAGGKRRTSDRLVPYCVFTDPPLARVGINEREAQAQGIKPRVALLPMAAVLRTEATSEKNGFMKALIGANDEILGFTMIGSEAGEVASVMQMAMIAKLPYTTVRDAVITHLTMAEGLNFLLGNVPAAAV